MLCKIAKLPMQSHLKGIKDLCFLDLLDLSEGNSINYQCSFIEQTFIAFIAVFVCAAQE